MVTWFAGLFSLPRLFVYHADCEDQPGHQRFLIMERKLFAIMTVGAVLTVVFGLWLLFTWHWPLIQSWLQLKLALVMGLVAYHLYCAGLIRQFELRENTYPGVFYRWFNEFPALILIAVALLAVLRPSFW
jgi:putative membrane protein